MCWQAGTYNKYEGCSPASMHSHEAAAAGSTQVAEHEIEHTALYKVNEMHPNQACSFTGFATTLQLPYVHACESSAA